MKIAIDSGPLASGHSIRGIGVYTRELLKSLKLEGVDISRVNLADYDIVHFTSFKPFVVSLPFFKPRRTKFVVTIYDLIPLIYPSHYPPGITGKINWLINKWLIKKNVDAIITISETSKKDICRFLSVDPKIVHVIYLAPRSIFKEIKDKGVLVQIKKKYSLPDNFVLYVGDINYNKNIPNLIEACKMAKRPLVIAGKQALDTEKQNLHHAELEHLINLDWSGVKRLGFVPDEDLVKIYNLASVYAQPSFYEGFGFGMLEALACGTPVVAAKTQALVEVAEGAATFVDPSDPSDIAVAFGNLMTRPTLSRTYSWSKVARETSELYAKI